jgi:hypothetical protein
MGQELPPGKYIGITHDYNARLNYYGWTAVAPWPLAYDAQMKILSGGDNSNLEDRTYWEGYFNQQTKGYDYFIVTIMGELDAQPVLANILGKYPSIKGDGYILYLLNQ